MAAKQARHRMPGLAKQAWYRLRKGASGQSSGARPNIPESDAVPRVPGMERILGVDPILRKKSRIGQLRRQN